MEDILTKQGEHTTQLAVYNTSLVEHMRRSDLLEQEQRKMSARVIPIEQHVLFVDKMVKGMIMLLAAVASIATAIHYLVK